MADEIASVNTAEPIGEAPAASEAAPSEAVPTPTPDTGAQPAGEQAASGSEPPAEGQPGEGEPKPKPKGGFQRRIDELTRTNHELRRQSQELLDRFERVMQGQPGQPGKPAQGDAEPNPENFQTMGEYVNAVAEQRAKAAVKAYAEEQSTKQAQASEREAFGKAMTKFNEGVDKARGEFEDFDEVAFESQYPVNEAMYRAIISSDQGPKLAYYFGKNPAEAARIANLDPLNAILEVGRLESRISAPASKVPVASKAPEPIVPVSGGKAADAAPRDNDDMKSWMAKRNAQVHT